MNKNLQSFIPHLFSVIKNCQDPQNYPVYYKFWKQINKEVLHQNDDYDTLCRLFRTFPDENRNTQFGSYFSVIAEKLISNIDNYKSLEKYSTAKYLKEKVINLKEYNILLEKHINKLDKNKNFREITEDFKQYILNSNCLINNFEIQKVHDHYVWISDNVRIIGKSGFCHYELITRKEYPQKIWIELHFDKKWKTKAKKILINSLDEDFFWNSDHKGGELSLALKENIDFNDNEILKKLESGLFKFDEILGTMVRSLYSINVKENFIDWFIKRDGEENNYFSKNFKSDKSVIKAEFLEYENFYRSSFDTELFTFNGNNIEYQITIIANNLKEKKSSFSSYYGKVGSGGKEAILGKKNYLRFLREYFEKSTSYVENDNIIIPLNKILYGPPGTGKTHKLLNEYYTHFEVQNKTVSKQEFEFEIINKLSWWQVFALILLENKSSTVPDIKKHRFVDYKLQVSNTKSLSQTVWGQLSAHTIEDSATVQYNKRTEPLIFNKSTGSVWEIVDDKKELIDELLELSQKIRNYKEKVVTSKNYKFITFHQSFSYEDFIEGIKPTLDKELNDESSEVSYTIEKGIFYECCNEAAKLAGFLSLKDSIENYTKEERVVKFENAYPYGLFIDEINRGNISQIFGELITVIEDTKRLGKDEIIVELPYSKDKFGVPSNLYIIGTMNTADRSVESLDTALRRRFCFEEMLPNLEVLNDKIIEGIELKKLLSTINKRVEILLDRDHTIGHSYFIDVKTEQDLRNTFKNNIIPLLQEYFYGDYEKIGMILGEKFFDVPEKYNKDVFASFPSQNYPESGSMIRLKVIDDGFNIIEALKVLLKIEVNN